MADVVRADDSLNVVVSGAFGEKEEFCDAAVVSFCTIGLVSTLSVSRCFSDVVTA